jgi:hypothetical protein
MPEKPSVTLPGTVNKIIPSVFAKDADTVQIGLETPHDLYREVRIENTLTNESGGKVYLTYRFRKKRSLVECSEAFTV